MATAGRTPSPAPRPVRLSRPSGTPLEFKEPSPAASAWSSQSCHKHRSKGFQLYDFPSVHSSGKMPYTSDTVIRSLTRSSSSRILRSFSVQLSSVIKRAWAA